MAITGAARGIGYATASELHRRGALVAIADIDDAEITRAAQRIGARVFASFDVTDRAAFDAFLADVEARLGPLDVMVNNAAICPAGGFLDESDTLTARTIAVNLFSVIVGTRLAAATMLRRQRGHIINVASVGALIPMAGVATYCGTKHGVLGFSDTVRLELRGTGVDVSTVLPAVTRTRMIDGLGSARGMPTAEPSEVAIAIVGLIRRPKPRRIVGRLLAVGVGFADRALPLAVNEYFRRVLGVDVVFSTRLNPDSRRQYEMEIRKQG